MQRTIFPRMETALSSASYTTSPSTTRRLAARVAFMGVNEPARVMLTDCFRQFRIETVSVQEDFAHRMLNEKLDGCVIRLGPDATSIMETARTSPANNRIILYGLGGSAHDAMQYSKYGVNAIFTEPLERSATLKLVRATHSLVLHEFRRYVRVPVATEVGVTTGDGRRFTATSQDISSGGISLRGEVAAPGTSVEISFALLTLPRIWVRGIVTWQNKEEVEIGIKFDPQDERRMKIKEWIDAYLGS